MEIDVIKITKDELDNIRVTTNYILLSTSKKYDDEFIKSDTSNLFKINTDKKSDHIGTVLKLGPYFYSKNHKLLSMKLSGLSVGDVVLYNPNAIRAKFSIDDDKSDKVYVIVPVYDIDCIISKEVTK